MGKQELKLMFALQWAILAGVLSILGTPLWLIALIAFMSIESSVCSMISSIKQAIKLKNRKESSE